MRKIHQSATLTTGCGDSVDLSGESNACTVCGSTEKRRVRYSFPPFQVVDCALCGTLHLSPLPSPELLAKIYNNNYYSDQDLEHGYLDYAAEATRIAHTYRRRLLYVRPFLGKTTTPRVLEIGAALGFGLPVARELFGDDIRACDVSREAVVACRDSGFRAALADPYGVCGEIEPHSLDLIYAFDVMEHLPDIRRFVRWLGGVIRPGGIFFVTTPDMDHVLNRVLGSRSPSIKIPQHVTYFTSDTLSEALRPCFTLRADRWDYQYVALGMLASRVAHILHLPPFRRDYGPTLSVPNGMRMFVFQKATDR